MGAHSVLGASSASRWMACPASVRLCKNIPSTSSSYADEGTAAHELAEMCLINNKNARHYAGKVIKVGGTGYDVDMEMIENVQEYVDAVRAAADGEPIGVEKRFKLDWLHPGMFGTNDASVIHAFDTLHIFDLKYGAGVPVEAVQNPQLMYYALGALGKDNPDMVEHVEMCIVQPRYDHPDGAVRRWRISVDELYDWAYNTLLPAAKAASKPNAPAIPGEVQCRWCKAFGSCSTVAKQSMDACQASFGAPPEMNGDTPELLTDEELSQAMYLAPLIRKWLDSVAGEILTRLNDGVDIPDYKLVRKQTKRTWENPTEAAAKLRELLGDEAVKLSPVGITDATKMLKRANIDVELIDRLTIKPEAGLTMAHVSDKRPAQASSATAAFGDPLFD